MNGGTSSTPLGQVRGTGSAHHGGEHWLRDRLTSAASLLLGLWLIVSLLLLHAAKNVIALMPRIAIEIFTTFFICLLFIC